MPTPASNHRANVEAAELTEAERACRSSIRVWLDNEFKDIVERHRVVGSWLDVGCGAGDYRRILSEANLLSGYVGIDISVETDRQWTEGAVTIREQRMDAAELGERFHDEFEAAISLMVFEHVLDDEAVGRAVHGALRTGALFVLGVPATAGATVWGPRHGFRWYTRQRVRELAAVSGFELIELRVCRGAASWIFESIRMMVPWIISKLVILAASAVTRGDRDAARERWPWIARVLPGLQRAHFRFSIGRALHYRLIGVLQQADRALAWPDIAYLAVLRKV